MGPAAALPEDRPGTHRGVHCLVWESLAGPMVAEAPVVAPLKEILVVKRVMEAAFAAPLVAASPVEQAVLAPQAGRVAAAVVAGPVGLCN